MTIRCPHCGHDNNEAAKFCSHCGGGGLHLAHAQPAPMAYIPTPSPAAIIAAAPQHLGDPAPASLPDPARAAPVLVGSGTPSRLAPAWLRWFRRTPIAAGVIERIGEHTVPPPPNYAWIAVRLAIVAAILPIALSLFTGFGILIALVLLLGGGLLLMVFGGVAGALGKLIALLLPKSARAGRDTTQVAFVIQEASGDEHAVVLYGERAGGRLHKGDVVQVYGRRSRDGDIRAGRVVVVGGTLAVGKIARRVVRGNRPLPAVIAVLAWATAAAVWVFLYLPVILPLLSQ